MIDARVTISDEFIINTVIGLARLSKAHRIILSGSNSPERMRRFHRRGYYRVATTANCGLPRGQFDAAFIEWPVHSIKALEATLDWLVHYLTGSSVLALWIGPQERVHQRKLRAVLARLGFHIEAGTRCEHGLAISARRLDVSQQAIAA